ncbi:hypothetical protein Taro_051264 [Colocasia esculenta]|uniref:Dirigent protein n=1 Tax=Colocasia esculenta TaxID=4460 RepID=A0A843XG30_COLES|nr:hypothetical protein [Colocasia esculenta]
MSKVLGVPHPRYDCSPELFEPISSLPEFVGDSARLGLTPDNFTHPARSWKLQFLVEEPALLMTMNYFFVTGVYNGSTLAILARNSITSETREMSVVGGTGYFRLARGYAVARTHEVTVGGDAIVEYNVYVTHY